MNTEQVVQAAVLEIARKRNPSLAEVKNEHRLIDELGLQSLEVAELVAMLEMRTGKDPFATQVSIGSVRTVDDLCRAYAL